MIARFEADMREVLPRATPATMDLIRELAELPLDIRGYGFIKDRAAEEAAPRRAALLAAIRGGGTPMRHAAE